METESYISRHSISTDSEKSIWQVSKQCIIGFVWIFCLWNASCCGETFKNSHKLEAHRPRDIQLSRKSIKLKLNLIQGTRLSLIIIFLSSASFSITQHAFKKLYHTMFLFLSSHYNFLSYYIIQSLYFAFIIITQHPFTKIT